MHVVVKQEYLTSVFSGWEITEGATQGGMTGMISSIDHPAFTATRNMLEAEGYIRVEYQWNNGDVVLKSFKFNDHWFNEGDQFPCATAMKYRVTWG